MEFDNGCIIFCIGDIFGKGVVVVLFMANFQVNFYMLIKKQADLGEFVCDFNYFVNFIIKGEWFIIFFIVVYDMKMQMLSYVNVGYNLFVLVNDGEV